MGHSHDGSTISWEGSPAGSTRFYMGSDFAGEARWNGHGDGYTVLPPKGLSFTVESFHAVCGELEDRYWMARRSMISGCR